MKKLLPIIFTLLLFYSFTLSPSKVLAGCNPPSDYSNCPELNPDWNLDILGYEPISGNLNLIDFHHPTDPNAPQLNTLIEGTLAPTVSSLYQMYYWDWATNSQGNLATRPIDLPGNFDFATLVGFSSQPGQAILVPNSGYDIGGGYGVMVIYADNNSLTLKYTPDDNVSVGYTLYLENIRVDSNLLAYYNQLNQAGRIELPALMAGMKIGEAIGNQILVAIRDTGMFLDPRWLNDWWQTLPAELRALILQALGLQTPIIPGCNVSNPGDQDSRPVPCDACNRTDLLTSSCATTFTVNDEVTYRRGEADFWCPQDNPKPWLERNWGGTVTVDPSTTTIPFVGKKGGEDEQKYLADYFEGTDKYYANYSDPTEAMNHLGIFRKLAPLQVQDDLKKQMVNRAHMSLLGKIQEGAIHDYLVEYNGESAKLSEFAGHYPPENPVERGKWEKETKWGRLWAAVPMFTREDTPGQILPYLGSRPKDRFEILNPEAQIEKVPHVARLYEVSQAINRILLPLIQEEPQSQVLGQQVLQAQTGEPSFSAYGYCTRLDGDYTVYLTVGFGLPPDHRARDLLVEIKSPITWLHICPNEKRCNNLVVDPFSVSGQPGGGINVSYHARADGVNAPPGSPWQPNIELNGSFAVQFTEDGCIIAGGPVPEPPTCGLRPPIPVNPCEKEAITDPNPNDDLCCSPINISLSATDQFENTQYIPCGVEITCDPDTGICRDACEQRRSHAVNRKVGISLLHPYLNEIWDYTADIFNGVFNIFRPETVPEFEDLDAASSVFYNYTPGSASPPGGDFYFPHLGGIQKAKEWVIAALNPQGRARAPGPAAPSPPTTLDYTIDFRNQNITILEETKNLIITMVKFYWPNTKIETHWDYVYEQAVAHGWNPAFVIALWIEESGASGVTNAYDLGCLGAPPNNLSAQLDCLFGRPYANESFAEFMCMYSEGAHAPCVFRINPNFPGNLKNWYDRLTQ